MGAIPNGLDQTLESRSVSCDRDDTFSNTLGTKDQRLKDETLSLWLFPDSADPDMYPKSGRGNFFWAACSKSFKANIFLNGPFFEVPCTTDQESLGEGADF